MKKLIFIIDFVLIAVIFIVIGSGNWVLSSFGDISFAQIVFTIMTSESGTNTEIVMDGVKNCIIFPVVRATIIVLVYIIIEKYLLEVCSIGIILKNKKKEYMLKYKCLSWVGILFLCIILIGTLWYCLERLGAIDYYIDINNPGTLYEEYYVNPEELEFEFLDEERNLIYIILESVEVTYASTDVGGAMDENRIPELTAIYQDNINFSLDNSLNGFINTSGTGWTAGSMTAQLLGVPLTLPIDGNSYVTDSFLSGAYGIGDILDSFGYNSSAVLGSDSDFGGRTMLYQDHGIDNIIDYKEAIATGRMTEADYVWWGYEDDKLFAYCKEEILRLANEEEPFFLTTLTADTHFEDGYVCEDCLDTFDDQYSNVIACSDNKVAEFVRWIQEQEFYDNTTIIIAGDHLTMDSDYLDDISSDYVRTTYYTIINSVVEAPDIDREYATMDLMPTALASMGIQWEGDRLALGTNLFGTEATLLEEMGVEELNSEIDRYSNYYYNELLYEEEVTLSDLQFELTNMVANATAAPPVIGTPTVTSGTGKITISVEITSNVGLEEVSFPTWSDSNGQDDIVWYSGSGSGNTYTVEIDFKDHNYETGSYTTHVYAYDTEGQCTVISVVGTITANLN
ncbi:MAG: GBS Bsp-like repeat-containing protein [Eubacteriales bacterium]